MKEQKLFFTRNGEYTVWEMLNHLDKDALNELFMLVFSDKKWKNTVPRVLEEYPSYIYEVYDEILSLEEDKNLLLSKIQEKFELNKKPCSDFNGNIYKFIGTSFDLKSAEKNLEILCSNTEEFQIHYFIYKRLNDINNIIDVRFTSEKKSYYKQNINSIILHTEIRVYLDVNIAVMTNFSEYTHSFSDKNKFISSVLSCISSHVGELEPVKLRDRTLRNLLITSKQMPSKLKFEVDGRLKIGVDINKSQDTSPLNNDEIKYFYDRYQLSLLRVVLSEEEGKCLTIDGDCGKIISKAQNIEVSDIDMFISKLSNLLKYDYLNYSYENDIKLLASRALTGTKNSKDNIVYTCYKEVETKIKEYCPESSIDYICIIKNAFFYCIKNHIFIDSRDINFIIDDKPLAYLVKICGSTNIQISKLFSSLIKSAKELDNNLESLITTLDDLLNSKRMVTNVAGF